MDNLALYRKYRPKDFKEVLGQEHITKVIENAVKTGNISHAYLFVGSRGTGKTSLARIFASNLGISLNDTYEIDAASNRGIDDIRELREGVRVLPFDSRYKIYIIDEVHMLSKDAWGALLKTLEEPPSHVIFVLATTEVNKVPDTIISRCQSFIFKKATDLILKEHLEDIAKKEGFEIEKGAGELIAILGDGSFRDAIGVLDKILNFVKKEKKKSVSKLEKINIEDIEKITGIPKRNLINSFLFSLIENNIEEGLDVIKKIEKENLDVKLFFKLFLQKFRIGIFLKYAPKLEEEIKEELIKEDFEFLKEVISNKEKSLVFNSKNLSILLESYANIDNSFISTMPLEIALIKIIIKE